MPSSPHLTSHTPTWSNLYLANFLATVVGEPNLHRYWISCPFSTAYITPKYHSRSWLHVHVLRQSQFYSEELSAPHPTPKLEDHTLSVYRGGLFNIFAATLQIGGHSSIRNLRMHHAVVTRTLLSQWNL
jgi:hypothetical protein